MTLGRMAKAERDEKAARAVSMSVRGSNYAEIAEELEVNWKTAKKLIEDELADRAEHRDQDRERAIARYEEVISEGWQRLSRLDDRSNNVTGVLNAIRGAQDSINSITGIEAPKKYRDEGPPRRFTLELGERTLETLEAADADKA